VDGNTLRAAYGTTKYCTAFLQHRQCQNPNCMYLHSEQDQDDTESHTREEVSTIQHAAKLGQNPASKGTPGTPNTKPPPTEDKPDRPILPTSVSWAKAAVGARAHSPSQDRIQDMRRQSIPSSVPSQPSPVSTPTPPPAVSPATVERSISEQSTPSDISLSLSTPEDRARYARGVYNTMIRNVIKVSFKYIFPPDSLDSDDRRLTEQTSPFFQFKQESEITENGDGEAKELGTKQEQTYSPKQRGFDPFASTIENGTHKREQSSLAYVSDPFAKAVAQPAPSAVPQTQLVRPFSPPRMSDPILAQQIQSTQSTSQFKTATPPPPGMYFSHVQQLDFQRRQQLLDQQRLQSYPANQDYGYYNQGPSSMRNYSTTYEDQDHAVYAPQARRHLLNDQGITRHNSSLIKTDQDINGSLMNMRMSPHLQQGFSGQQPPPPQSYAGQQGNFVGRRYMGSAF
jgi:hypothetical protein